MQFRVLVGFVAFAVCPVLVEAQDTGYNPWKMKLPADSVPKVTEWRGDDTEGKVMARTDAALREGAAAMEALAGKLISDEVRDGDGRYASPYFYRVIGREGEAIKGKDRLTHSQDVVAEWRKKFPQSLPAMAAEARLCNEMAARIRGDTGDSPTIEGNYKRVQEVLENAMDLLEKSRELRTKDAGWHVTRMVTAGMLGDGRSLDKAMDDLLECFPECGYAIARGISRIQPDLEGDHRKWDKWLRGKLAKLPPDVAAKSYTLTISEMGRSSGVSNALFGVSFDRGMIHRGLDALAAQYPTSIGLATEEAALSAFGLYEPKRVQAALKRAGGRLDEMTLRQSDYEYLIWVMTWVPWEPARVGLPEITSYTMVDTAFHKRMEEAAAEGPRAMELLFQRFRSEEIRDKDGGYNSCSFCAWFAPARNNQDDLRKMMEKEKLLEAWEKEFPDSSLVKLVLAHHWTNRAWLARSGVVAGAVSDTRWEGFGYCLKKASGYLAASAELRETEPAWLEIAVRVMMGAGKFELEGEELAGLVEPMFENFPDSRECHLAIINASAPRWGGKPGGWEKFLKKALTGLPEDVRARAYASAVISTEGYAFEYSQQRKERYGDSKPDKALVRKGLESLVAAFPASQYFANAEALVYSDLSEDPEKAYAAMKRMNGRLDLRVWWDYSCYNRCVRWVTWKKSSEPKTAEKTQ